MSDTVIVRIWRTEVDQTCVENYERFAVEQSLPMFNKQSGCLGVLFTRAGTHCAVMTLWEHREAAEDLERSPSYRRTVADIMETGFLVGDQSVEMLEVHGGDLSRVAHLGL